MRDQLTSELITYINDSGEDLDTLSRTMEEAECNSEEINIEELVQEYLEDQAMEYIEDHDYQNARYMIKFLLIYKLLDLSKIEDLIRKNLITLWEIDKEEYGLRDVR